MDMPVPAHNSLTPSPFGSVSASFSPSFTLLAVTWTALSPALEARFSAFNAWCAEVQATPVGKVIIALLCLVEITLVTLVLWRVRKCSLSFAADITGYLRQQIRSEPPAESGEKAPLA